MTEKIWDFIERKKFFIFFIIITAISLVIRVTYLEHVTHDMTTFLEPWFHELKDNGGLQGLKLDIGNYNAPYITILALLTYLPIEPLISIKVVSIIFDYVCAFAAMRIVYIVLKNNKNKDFYALLIYGIVLLLPTVILNSSCWGQADAIYVAFILWAIAYLMEEKYIKAFIFLGISFAFKLQFIFILPLFILVYISQRKFPLYYFLIIPAVNMLMCLPAIVFGKTISSCIDVYINQSQEYSCYLSLNLPNIYYLLFPSDSGFVNATDNYTAKIGILITIFIYVIMAFMVFYKKIKWDGKKIIEFGLLSVMLANFLLPHMHERYLYAGDILAVLYCICNKNRLHVAIGVTLVSLNGYVRYLFGQGSIPMQYVALLFFVMIAIISKDIFNQYFAEKNGSVEKKELL